jgi:regulator of sigma E protease
MDGIFDLMGLVATNVWIYGVTFLLILSILVFVHEWGHYIVARMCGVRVETFSIGFGKEIFGKTDKHGTRWSFSLIPLGGYVKMFGDSDPASAGHVDSKTLSESDRSEAFFAKSVGKRAAIVFAGPAINFIFAIILFAGLYSFSGKPMTMPLVTGIEQGAAADQAGFLPNDKIVEINGKAIESFEQVRRTVILALDTPLEFKVLRDDKEILLSAIPEKRADEDRFGFKHERGYLGLIGASNGLAIESIIKVNGKSTKENPETTRALLQKAAGKADKFKPVTLTLKHPTDPKQNSTLKITLSQTMNPQFADTESKDFNVVYVGPRDNQEFKKMNPFEATITAVTETYRISVDTLGALGQMIIGVRSPNELGGIIRIGAMAGDMAERGLIAIVTFTALLSINLGLINLFPIPMLDGGHLTFYAVEAVRGKPLSERIQEYAFRFGLVILVCFMVFANLNDIIQLLL